MAKILNNRSFKALLDGEIERKAKSIVHTELAAVQADLQTVKQELYSTKQALASAESRLSALTSTGQAEDSRLQTALNRVTEVHHRQEAADKASRSNNLVLKGLPEEVPGQDLNTHIGDVMQATGAAVPVLEARRLGAPRQSQAGRPPAPRPVLLRFPTESAKHAALKHSKALRARKIYMDPDLTPAQQRAKASKGDKFQLLKQRGMHPFWRGELLFFREGERAVEFTGEILPGPPSGQRTGAGSGGASHASGSGPQGQAGARA